MTGVRVAMTSVTYGRAWSARGCGCALCAMGSVGGGSGSLRGHSSAPCTSTYFHSATQRPGCLRGDPCVTPSPGRRAAFGAIGLGFSQAPAKAGLGWGARCALWVRWVGARGPSGVTPRHRVPQRTFIRQRRGPAACGETPAGPRAPAVGRLSVRLGWGFSQAQTLPVRGSRRARWSGGGGSGGSPSDRAGDFHKPSAPGAGASAPRPPARQRPVARRSRVGVGQPGVRISSPGRGLPYRHRPVSLTTGRGALLRHRKLPPHRPRLAKPA